MSGTVWRFLIGVFLIAPGLIHAAYASPPPPPGPVRWPFNLNYAWLLNRLGLRAGTLHAIGTMLWLVVVIGFVAAGLGVFGVPILHGWWRTLALIAAAFSLALLILYWASMLVLGVVIDIGVFIALFWANGPSADGVGA